MRVVLLAMSVAVLAGDGCPGFGGKPKLPGNTVVRFSRVDAKTASSVRDTIIRTNVGDSILVHIALPDSCLRPKPPPSCPPLLSATRTDTIIR